MAIGLLIPQQTNAITTHEEIKTEVKEERVLTIEEKIIGAAKAHDYSPERALSIARAESGLNPKAKNAVSSASGIYQFINGTFQGYCIDKYHLTDSMEQKNDPDIQIECAVRILSEGGESHWKASRSHWK